MLRQVDLADSIEPAAFKAAVDALEIELGTLQRRLRDAQIPTVIVVEGWDASGKGESLGHLLHMLDPRWYAVRTNPPPSEEELLRPWLRRFWMKLPRRGNIVLYDEGWYREVLDRHARGELQGELFDDVCRRIRRFEQHFTDDGGLLLKFFLHVTKEEQARRFDLLQRDPAFTWRVGEQERLRHEQYDAFFAASDRLLQSTHAPYAPWHVIPATDQRFASLQLMKTLKNAGESALSRTGPAAPVARPPVLDSRLERAPTRRELSKKEYKEQVPQLQQELRRLQHLCYMQRVPVVIVFEGQDAAGKGGAIRRMVREMDPRGYEVIPVAAPAGEEREHHYLWRFWRDVPKAGHIGIFDRSWYGRILVERIEGFAKVNEWVRAYQEINDFEAELVHSGALVIKFWMHLSKEEQLARFKARERTAHKKWKITEEDWRNRKRWKEYQQSASDMIALTNTPQAPWVIVPADDKPAARVLVMREVVSRLSGVLV